MSENEPRRPEGAGAPGGGESHPAEGKPGIAPAEGKPEIAIEEFGKLDLRVARVLRVERHPNAEKLLKIAIDLGPEAGGERQIVAGIAPWYQPEDLVGKSIVVVANLKPAKLRGEWSQGMLLAASGADTVSVLTPLREVPPGSTIR